VEEREREERKGLHWVQPQNAPTPPTAKVSERERGERERERERHVSALASPFCTPSPALLRSSLKLLLHLVFVVAVANGKYVNVVAFLSPLVLLLLLLLLLEELSLAHLRPLTLIYGSCALLSFHLQLLSLVQCATSPLLCPSLPTPSLPCPVPVSVPFPLLPIPLSRRSHHPLSHIPCPMHSSYSCNPAAVTTSTTPTSLHKYTLQGNLPK